MTPEQEAQEAKVQENRLRRAAARQGYRLIKNRRRDPRAIGYGTFAIANVETNLIEAENLLLDDVEKFLTS